MPCLLENGYLSFFESRAVGSETLVGDFGSEGLDSERVGAAACEIGCTPEITQELFEPLRTADDKDPSTPDRCAARLSSGISWSGGGRIGVRVQTVNAWTTAPGV